MGCCWAAELDRRVRELDEGKVETIPWSVVKARLEERLRSR
jgi:putative addiction module component (TIGR02574 family)